jgi:hypothetical protein
MHARLSCLVANLRGAGKPAPPARARFTVWIRKTIPSGDRSKPPSHRCGQHAFDKPATAPKEVSHEHQNSRIPDPQP